MKSGSLEWLLNKIGNRNKEMLTKEVYRPCTGPNTSYYVIEGKSKRDSVIAELTTQNQYTSRSIAIGANSQAMSSFDFTAAVFKELTTSKIMGQNYIAS